MKFVFDDFGITRVGASLACFKGGGGGASGKVEYQAYLTSVHTEWLNDAGSDSLDLSIADSMNAAFGASPYVGKSAYNPDTAIAAALAGVGSFETYVGLLSSGTGLDALIEGVLDETRITNAVAAYTTELNAQIEATLLPKFEAGMRDVNAVISSAFVLGRAQIMETVTRQVAAFEANLRLKAFSDDAIRVIELKLRYQQALATITGDMNRIKIVAKKEQVDKDLEIDTLDAKWDFEVFQSGANMLAAVHGGTVQTGSNRPSPLASAIGGGLAGAAAGFQLSGGNPIGAVIGGLLGLGSSFL